MVSSILSLVDPEMDLQFFSRSLIIVVSICLLNVMFVIIIVSKCFSYFYVYFF